MDYEEDIRSAVISYVERLYTGNRAEDLLASATPSEWDDRISNLARTLDRAIFRRTSTFDEDRSISFDILLSAGAMAGMDLSVQVYPPEFKYSTWQIDRMRRLSSLDWGNLFVSVLGPYYTFGLQRVLPGASSGWVTDTVTRFGELGRYKWEQERIQEFFAGYAYDMLGDTVVRSHCENVTLPYTEPENVTVLTCLLTGADYMPD